ncbi:hypothetical protein [Hyalangium sp.]|uniref:hypothetical protein n=1 Tax=Hyalangium sp. TaxID=2028555 RepID=UPI002D3A2029|nr:hypothetical protein [Hyalangium sp.]HYH96367.1 hypothetical protein [Hyalangium sp.]
MTLWTQPVGALALWAGFRAVTQEDTYLMVPVGANVPLSPTQELVLELTPIWTRQDCEARCSSLALAVAVGTAWAVAPNGSGGGFFLQPKLVGVVSRDSREAGFEVPFDEGSWSATRGQLSLGLDVGYRMNFGRFFMAFVLGGSVGLGWDVPTSSHSIFFSLLDWPQRSSQDKVVWDFNLHLLRLGASF